MFEKGNQPLVCAFVQEDNPSDAIRTLTEIRKGGTDVIGLQLCCLRPEYRTREIMKTLFESTNGLPVYLTDYKRFDRWENLPWEAKRKSLLFGAECGADLIDVPGNMFSDDAYELTFDQGAVKKQQEFVAEIHALGKKALFSTHILQYTPSDDVLRIALEQQKRGADVAKIVTASDTEEQLIDNLFTTKRLNKELKIPFVFVSGGAYGKTHRMIGPYLGACMWFCAPKYGKYDTKAQPTLEEVASYIGRNDGL